MEDIEIYGKNTKDIPSFNTIKTFEKRKNYIIKKLESKIEKESYSKYLVEELRALERVTNFIKWIQNNLANDLVKEMINQYKIENDKGIDEENETEIKNNKDEIVYGIIDEMQGRNHKFKIILTINDGINYISISSQRRKKNIMWEMTKEKEIKMTTNKLEKILRKVKEINLQHGVPVTQIP